MRRSEIEPVLLDENLDSGEIETIHLAVTMKSSIVLFDEEEAREVARNRKLKVKGTIGVIIEAFRKHILDFEEAELILEEIKHRSDIWISSRLCNEALRTLRT